LSDFGCATSVRGQERDTYIGTKDYQSPEMVMTLQYGKSTDVWSIGILMYELLMGVAPRMNSNRAQNGVKVFLMTNLNRADVR
jgi:serine/threonine protein kinase